MAKKISISVSIDPDLINRISKRPESLSSHIERAVRLYLDGDGENYAEREKYRQTIDHYEAVVAGLQEKIKRLEEDR